MARTEGNTLGVQTAILEGDPSKPGFYLTINRFPPGVMSRPHYHPDERNITVIRGTAYRRRHGVQTRQGHSDEGGRIHAPSRRRSPL